MPERDEQRMILEMIASGRISAAEGLELLQALGEAGEPDEFDEQAPRSPEAAEAAPHAPEAAALPVAEPQQEPGPSPGMPEMPDFKRYRSYWTYPLWIGVGTLVLGASLMYWAQQAGGLGLSFFLASLVFLLGLLATTLAVAARRATWLHLRVLQTRGDEWPPQMVLAFPLPVGVGVWFVRTFKPNFRDLDQDGLEETLQALRAARFSETPIYLEVNDEEDGEKIQLFIG